MNKITEFTSRVGVTLAVTFVQGMVVYLPFMLIGHFFDAPKIDTVGLAFGAFFAFHAFTQTIGTKLN